MTTRKQMLTVVGFFVALLLSVIPSESIAQEASPKEKSMALAIGLGLSPVPGDGLIYAGAKTAGIIDLAVGLTGWTLVTTALVKCDDLDDCGFPGVPLFAAGLGLAGITYLIDSIGAPVVASDYNKKLRVEFKPVVIMTPQKSLFGVAFNF